MVAISIIAAIMAVSLVLVLIIEGSPETAGGQYASYIGRPVSAAVMEQVTSVGVTTLSAIGLPSSVTPPATVSGSPLMLNGKPEVLYVGGEFCPFCALERWSLMVALSHFGTFSGVEYMQSSSTDVDPNTPTFTFANATYTSQYITFVAVEELNQQDKR